MKHKIEFKPWLRPDKRYAFQIFVDGQASDFIWFIESTTGVVYSCSRGDITCGTTYSLEECEGNCNWLNARVSVEQIGNKKRIIIGGGVR